MNKDKLTIYASAQRTFSSPREIEAEVLTLGAHKLIYCRDHWEEEERKKKLAEALKFNQRLWSIFQANLIETSNLLPKNIKLNLLKLGAYIDRQIFQIMAHPSPDKLTPIIDINLCLATGLRKKPVSSSQNDKG